ncbi:MAG TPA: TIGR01906 family membrane protein [Chloroflexota bacterium]|nr:TIGR01906 family membrane protein [Chloroflexota bacterium]
MGSAASSTPASRPAAQRYGALLVRVGLGVASGLCLLALPLGLVASNVRAVALDRSFYLAEFARHGSGAATGLSAAELQMVAEAFIAYFQAAPGTLDVRITRDGALVPLFNTREVAHMEDVQALMHLVFRVQMLALGYLAVFGAVGLVVGRSAFLQLALRLLGAGAALTIAMLLVLGGLVLTDFSSWFLRFHLVSFANDLWMLDPRRDNLIRLFPEGFFQDAALRVVGLTLAEALLVGIGALGGLRLVRR